MTSDSSVRRWTIVGAVAAVVALPVAVIIALADKSDSIPTDTPSAPSVLASMGVESAAATQSRPATTSAAGPPSSSARSSFGPPQSENPQGPPKDLAYVTLCNVPGASPAYCRNTPLTIDVGDQVFSYYGSGNVGYEPPDWGNLLKFPANTCSKLVIRFALKGPAGPGIANIRVIQSEVAPVAASAQAGTIGTLTVDLNGSPFFLQYNSTTDNLVYVDGYATCRTSSGV